MVFRCELCDSFLPLLQFSRLCPTCYKIRTIIKCYDAGRILNTIEHAYKVADESDEGIADDKKDYDNPTPAEAWKKANGKWKENTK